MKLHSFFRQHSENQSEDVEMEEVEETAPILHTDSEENASFHTVSISESAAGSIEQYVYQYQLLFLYKFIKTKIICK